MNYFIIYSNDDGQGIHGPLSKEETEKRLEDNYYGNIPILKSIPIQLDYELGLIVIKGEIVIPEPIKVATKYKL